MLGGEKEIKDNSQASGQMIGQVMVPQKLQKGGRVCTEFEVSYSKYNHMESQLTVN